MDIPWITSVNVMIHNVIIIHRMCIPSCSIWSIKVMVANSLPELVEAMTSNAQDGVELSQGKT